jgi:nucleoside-diphosphate-sugar epimerase
MQRPVRLVNVPVPLLRFAASVTGQMAQFTRLCSSLTVDMSETMRILKWQPPYSVEESLAKTVAWYRERR